MARDMTLLHLLEQTATVTQNGPLLFPILYQMTVVGVHYYGLTR